MSFEIILTDRFDKEGDRLKKRYRSYKTDFKRFLIQLEKDPLLGVSIGKSCRKVRFAIKRKGKGKSGGARVITYVFQKGETVYLLSIYDKGEKVDLLPGELDEMLANIK